jgi:hypothetical protein
MARKRTRVKGSGKHQRAGRAPHSRAAAKRAAAAKGKSARRDALDDFIQAGARILDLPVEPAWHDAIKANLATTLRLAASFADFPLPDDAEPAPIFVA